MIAVTQSQRADCAAGNHPAEGTRQRGVSLVEVLVAVVVLSIGLLGLAGLQASGMRVGQSSIHRGQAAQLAYDMVDRLRVNIPNAASYNIALADAPPTTDTIPARDLRDWRRRLLSLPGGTGSVAVAGKEVTIVVQWDDTRGGNVLRGNDDDNAARAALQASQFRITTQLAN
jgi:type IV pilus assembly protein PilV